MEHNSSIYVAGHSGMVVAAIVRALRAQGYTNLLLRTHQELNLEDGAATLSFFEQERPEYVVLAAAGVGGIADNIAHPAEFIYQNSMIQCNVIHAAHLTNVKKLLFLGSSCAYPAESPQPMKEAYLLDGKPEKTNEAYAIAKIAGVKMCQFYQQQYGDAFISVMPPNMYGPYDNFSDERSYVMSALIRRIHLAKQQGTLSVEIWGTGKARREFLYVNDFADVVLYLLRQPIAFDIINVGCGKDTSIKELAETIRDIIGYTGDLLYDLSKPDGMFRKCLDTTNIEKMGWVASTTLRNGIRNTYDWYLQNIAK